MHAANQHDTVAGCGVFKQVMEKYPSIKEICADAGYRKTIVDYVEKTLNRRIEISQKITPGWTVLAKRWVVERTFAWFNTFRRLSKDHEINTNSAEALIMIAHSMTLIKRFSIL